MFFQHNEIRWLNNEIEMKLKIKIETSNSNDQFELYSIIFYDGIIRHVTSKYKTNSNELIYIRSILYSICVKAFVKTFMMENGGILTIKTLVLFQIFLHFSIKKL